MASDGVLWIGTRGGGAVTYDGRRFRRVPISGRFIISFAESGDGAIWIGAPGALFRHYRGEYTKFSKEEGYPGGRLTAIAADRDGVYAALPQGVVRIGANGAREWTGKLAPPGGAVTALMMTGAGLLAGTESGVVSRLEGERFVRLLDVPGGHPVSSFMEGPKGSLWLSTSGGGVFRHASGELEALTERHGLTTDSVNQLIEDDEGNIWAATTGGGLVRITQARLKTIVPKQKLSGDWILSLVQSRDGSVWFSTNGGGLNHLTDHGVTRMTTADGLGSNAIMALAEDRSGALWVGHEAGLQRIVGGRVVQSFSAKDGLEGQRVHALSASRDGSMWVGTSGGLHRIVRGAARKLTEKDGLAPGPVVGIREAADGSLWLATMNSVEHFKERRATRFSREQGLASSTVTGITIDEVDGSIWVATGHDGIMRIRDGRVSSYRAANGLLSDTAYTILQDREGNLWVSTSFGLYTVKRNAFERFDRGEIDRIPTIVFRKSDGLKSSDFSGGFDRPGFRAFDGTLWFPTTRGLVVVDPKKLRENPSPPRVAIETISANGVDLGVEAPLVRAHHGKRSIEIAYTSPTFHSPDTITFRYKLVGFDDEWHDAGKRRTAYYTNVSPGNYHFIVRATSSEGVSRDAATTIRVEPQFYETGSFQVAGIAVVLLLAWGAHRRRIGELQKHERALRKSEDHFRSLIENAPDMILIIDRVGRIAYASPSVRRTLGEMPEMRVGREMRELLVEPTECDRFLGEVRRGACHSATLRVRDASGSSRDVEIIGATVSHSDEVVLNCRDITDRRKLESKLEQASRLASLGRLAATVSHEFNNVLMGIQPFVEIIRRKSTDETVQNATTRITQSLGRGKRISEEILRYTRPVEPSVKPVEVRSWLLDLETEIRSLVGPSVRMAILAPEGLAVSADVAQLNQVLTNLAINARDAGATSVRLDVRKVEGDGDFEFGIVRDPERFAHLSFCDNGTGIADSVLPHIFEPLFTTKKTKGTGLGLAVAHQVVSAHGGEIFVESKVGTGTTFHIFLPIARSEAGELLSGDDEIVAAPSATSCRVLVVEDDTSVADGMLSLLELEGFTVALAPSGGDALSMIPRFAPDVIVLDVGLPDIDGIELYRRLKKQWPQLRVIFSTGHGDIAALQETMPPPAPLYLQKPYSIETLVTAIATATGHDRVVA